MAFKEKFVFVDTNVFVHIFDANSLFHKKAKNLIDELKSEGYVPVTSSFNLAESFTVIAQKIGKEPSRTFHKWYSCEGIKTLHIDQAIFERTTQVFLETRSKNISFVDCSIKAICERAGIKKVFSFDKDLKKLGLILVN